jgi:hypothetical protein
MLQDDPDEEEIKGNAKGPTSSMPPARKAKRRGSRALCCHCTRYRALMQGQGVTG